MTDVVDWPDWRIKRVHRPTRGSPDLVVEAVYERTPRRCPKCSDRGCLQGHGHKITKFRDVPVKKTPVVIQVYRSRYRCVSCFATSLQPLDDMDSRYRMTHRLIRFIQTEAAKRPFTEIAARTGVHEKTIRRIVGDRVPDLISRARFAYGPPVLLVGQIRLQGRLRTILVDYLKFVVVDLLPAVRPSGLEEWLARLPSRDRARIHEVVVAAPKLADGLVQAGHHFRIRPVVPHAAVEGAAGERAQHLEAAFAQLGEKHGRLSFKEARAKILSDAALERPKDMIFCEQCRQDFGRNKLRGKLAPHLDGTPSSRRRRMCWQCDRYTDRGVGKTAHRRPL